MAAHWWWTWSIGLPASAYTRSNWALSSSTTITTNGTTLLNTPPPTSNAPGEQHSLEIGTGVIESPVFNNGTLSEGWFIVRWNGTGLGTLSNSSLQKLVELVDNSTVRITLRPTSNGATSTLSLLVNGTLIGTSSTAFGDGTAVLAIDFDLTQTPPQAGLVVNGVREITRAGGSGSPTTIDRMRLSGGKGGNNDRSYFGDVMIFDDLNDFPDIATTQDIWVTYLAPVSVNDPDNSWTPSAGSDLDVLSDESITTYTQTVADPDDIFISFQTTSDRQPGWNPTLIYGVAGIAYTSGAVITTSTLSISDSNALVGSDTETINAIGYFIGTWEPLDSQAAAWTAFEVNSIEMEYQVSS